MQWIRIKKPKEKDKNAMILRLISIYNDALLVTAVVDDEPIRDEGTPEDPDPVYRVRRIDVVNTTGQQWYLLIRQAGAGRYESVVLDQTEQVTSLAPAEQFDTFELEIRAGRNINS